MEEITIKNYQELAMCTRLPSDKNWEYCYCLIASEIYEAFGKWGKQFRDNKLYKDALKDKLGDVFGGIALACELDGEKFENLWYRSYKEHFLLIEAITPHKFSKGGLILNKLSALSFAKTFAEECGIDPLDCLKRNITKLADRQAEYKRRNNRSGKRNYYGKRE